MKLIKKLFYKYQITFIVIIIYFPFNILFDLTKMISQRNWLGTTTITTWGIVSLLTCLTADNYVNRADTEALQMKRRIWSLSAILIIIMIIDLFINWFLV